MSPLGKKQSSNGYKEQADGEKVAPRDGWSEKCGIWDLINIITNRMRE